MSKVTPRSRFLRASRISACALLVGIVVRFYGYLAWDWSLTSAEAIVSVFIGCVAAFWFTWDSAGNDTGRAQTK